MKKTILISTFFLLAFVLTGCNANLSKNLRKNINKNSGNNITLEEAKAKTENFVNNNLMSPGDKAEIKSVSEEGGLFKIAIGLPNGQEVITYLTKDGKRFFPQAMDIAEVEKQNASQVDQSSGSEKAAPPAAKVSKKNSKPQIELFVMSHCPYGTQIEKGILPVAEALGNKVDFKIKFCGYAMHGEKELDEQLNQYCVQKEEPAKFQGYLKCFLEDGNSDRCVKVAGVNDSKMKKCVASADKQYKVKEKFKDQSTWSGGRFPVFDVFKADNEKYGVQGSPTLIINGEEVQAGRDSASLLSVVCSAFDNAPEECKKQLSSAAPSPGFGAGTSGSSDAAGCAAQ